MYASQGRAVLATDLEGQITGDPRHGLFVHETRLLSRYRYLVNGEQPVHIASSNVEQHSWLGYFGIAPPGKRWKHDTGSGAVQPVSEHTIELKVSRTVGLGVHEDIDLKNFTQEPTRFRFAIDLDADFAGQAETDRPRHGGRLLRRWQQADENTWELLFDHYAEHFYNHMGNRGWASLRRRLKVRLENCASSPKYGARRITFRIRLAPGATWHACLKFIAEIDGEVLPPLYGCREFFGENNDLDRKRHLFLAEAAGFETPASDDLSSVVYQAAEQSKQDLAALRLYDLDYDDRAWTLAAGLPIYIALFGRDTLTSSWQAALLGPELMRGTLEELPKWQGTEVNDWRDEQPGKMLHEAHTGPLATLFYNPRKRYYGAATTSSFYAVVLAELWHWTGDKDLIRPFLDPALRALQWKDDYAQLEQDGFYYYQSRSTQGNKNQGWKDSGDAIVYEDGSQVPTPIATCEEQAFVYSAKLLISEVLWFMDQHDLAKRFFHEASELKKRFNEKFWMPEKEFFALGLDPSREPIRSIASNPGHLLACGIVEEPFAAPTARRLMQPDLFTGWGIRTLSSDHPSYDPYSYHRGSVWPVEQATFALGFTRYGLIDDLHRLTRAVFEATTLFNYNRLPECFSGHQRDREHPFPALYPKTNWPQAWSASAIFLVLQSLLGIYPYAPMKILFVDPQLPVWLPEITMKNLRVGEATVSIRFYRKGETSHYEVLEKRGVLHIVRQPSPWSLTASFGERFRDALASLVP